MQQDPNNTTELINLLLEKCDRQYQEIQLLKGKLEDHTDVDALKSSYEQTISGKPGGLPEKTCMGTIQ